MIIRGLKWTIKRIVACLMWVVSMFYTYQMSLYLKGYRNIIYSLWIKIFFVTHHMNVR